MLDSELGIYIHKPDAYAGVSSGQWGGVRAIEDLLSTVREIGLVSTFADILFPNVREIFDDQGKFIKDDHRDYLKNSWVELIWVASVLQHDRLNQPSKYHK